MSYNAKFSIRYLISSIFIAATFSSFAACSTKEPQNAAITPKKDRVEAALILHDVKFTETKKGALFCEVFAKKAIYSKKDETAELEHIKVDFPSKNGISYSITADKGFYSSVSKDLKLSGNVHGVSSNGAVFDTDYIDYKASGKVVSTDKNVRFSHERLSLNADGMKLDLTNKKVTFLKNCNSIIKTVSVADRGKK